MVAEHITDMASEKNSGKRAHTLMLVVHSAETPLAAGYAQSVTQNWLNRPDVEASINAFAGPDTLVRSVHTDYAAWHATWANALSVGYEMTGYAAFTRAQWLTEAGQNMIDRLAQEMAQDAAIYGIPLVWLSTAQVNAIRNGDRSTKGLATHAQIDPANRTDPGSGFPYDVLLSLIQAYSGVPTPPPVIEVPTPPAAGTFPAWVEDGDSLWSIAQQFGTTIDAILAVNSFTDPNVIYPGQLIYIPVGGQVSNTPSQYPYCFVEDGDTLSGIGAQFGVDWQTIANLNKIPAPYVIYPGQKLYLR